MPNIKIYSCINAIEEKTLYKMKRFNYYKTFNDNIYYLPELIEKYNGKHIKEKPVLSLTFLQDTLPIEWQILLNPDLKIENFKLDDNGKPIKNSFELLYFNTVLDALMNLNNIKDNTTDSKILNLIEERINFLYELPMLSIILVDYKKNLEQKDFQYFIDIKDKGVVL